MSVHAIMRRVGVLLVLLLAMGACGGKDSPSGSSAVGNAAFLIQHNVDPGGIGRTVRWPDGAIRVFTNGIAGENEVTAWTGPSGGRVNFAFVGSPPGNGITFGFTNESGICGATQVEYSGGGVMTFADTRVVAAVFRGPQCVRTVTHETGHALGFFGHTRDGGLMDDDGGNGAITGQVAQMLQDLYSLAPGSAISAEKTKFALLPSAGRRTLRFVYPLRP